MSDEVKTEQPSKAKMRRGTRIVLIVSLALNLLVVGLAVGAVLSGGPKGHRDMRMPPHVRALAPADRRAIGQEIRKAHRAGALGERSGPRSSGRLADLLAAVPFDRAAVADLQEQTERAERARFSAARDIWLDHVAQMSDAERAAYAERLREVWAKKGKDKPKHD
ncbi:MAG: periplasmic heavy metal sensor [Rhodobacteraceae bacterium]|nr:periplasmic heavy metal sensor [Paracoccaceae bacterium]